MPKPLSSMDIRVAMGDVDAARIIYFVAPLRWQEALFTGWLQGIGHPLSEMIDEGYAVPTVSCTADYMLPLCLDDAVRLELYADHVGTQSFRVRCDVVRARDDSTAVRISSSHVWAHLGYGRPGHVKTATLPGWLRDALSPSASTSEKR